MTIEINNLTNFRVDKKFFTGVAKKVLSGENRARENLSVAFVGLDEIQKLNAKYRKKNKPTDVLSFEKVSQFKNEFAEVVICPKVVKDDTANSPLSLKKEMAKVLIHGILHILGYDHEKLEKEAEIMAEKEKKYFSKINKI